MADQAAAPEAGFDEQVIPDVDDVVASDERAPVLIEPDQGWIQDDEAAVVADEAEGEAGSLSAEESAINVISEDDAPGLTFGEGAGYLDEE